MPGGEFPMAEAMPAQSPTNTEQNHANAGQGHANAGQGHANPSQSHVLTQCDLVPRLVRGHPGKAAHRVRAMRISEKLWAAATPTLATGTGDSESRARDGRGRQTPQAQGCALHGCLSPAVFDPVQAAASSGSTLQRAREKMVTFLN